MCLSSFYTILLVSLIHGDRHIVQELQMETAKASQRNKVLESENKLLLSEMDQLREVRAHFPQYYARAYVSIGGEEPRGER